MCPTKIKICGITRFEDALEAAQAGADFLGFNFYPLSPRYIAPTLVRKIVDLLKADGFENVLGVGVFVNEPPERIREVMAASGLTAVQLHGDETPAEVSALSGFFRIKAVKVRDARWADELARYGADAYLADAPHMTLPGGSGQSYDYAKVTEAAAAHMIFLAGGLTPETVGRAVEVVRPFAVDVASGVESAPGQKDANLVRAFIQRVRAADEMLNRT